MPRPPKYYDSLGPFRRFFQTGVPALTYHKIGPRPRRVQIKGLYLSAKLFARQMAELAAAGFSTVPLSGARAAGDNRDKRLALTFDDGFRSVRQFALEPLAQFGFRAIEFLVSDLLGQTNAWETREGEAAEPLMDAHEIRDWLAAGHDIGSHSRTHPRLTRLSAEEALEEIVSSKKQLEDQFGRAIEHFCYPYGDWNDRVRDLVLEAGYKTACTVQFGLNTAETPPYALRRITARYRSRNLKNLRQWLAGWRRGEEMHD